MNLNVVIIGQILQLLSLYLQSTNVLFLLEQRVVCLDILIPHIRYFSNDLGMLFRVLCQEVFLPGSNPRVKVREFIFQQALLAFKSLIDLDYVLL